MKKNYYNEITRFFDKYRNEPNSHYICYDEEDIEKKELRIKYKGITVGAVILNNSNKIFAVYVRTDLVIKYTDAFEKSVSDKYMDLPYKFDEDEPCPEW